MVASAGPGDVRTLIVEFPHKATRASGFHASCHYGESAFPLAEGHSSEGPVALVLRFYAVGLVRAACLQHKLLQEAGSCEICPAVITSSERPRPTVEATSADAALEQNFDGCLPLANNFRNLNPGHFY